MISKEFYSMRHTVTDTLKQAGELETVIAELVGHSTSGSMTMGRYGKRYQPKVLLEALVQLDYGLEIDPVKL
jgi:integrase